MTSPLAFVRFVSHALACCSLLALAAPRANAQVSDVPASGCSDGSGVGEPLFVVDDAPPTIDSPDFAIEHVCDVSSTSAFFLMGNCNAAGPLPNWPLASPCFGGWSSPPGTCGLAIDPSLLLLLGGADARSGKVLLSLPIPNSPGLIGLEQCFQFICVDLGSATPCTGISQGLSIVFQP